MALYPILRDPEPMIKVGIFFGGQSREREISFAGGRTVYDNLNKELFEAIPIFVDSTGKLVLLDWHFIYKGTIRDFFPPAQHQPNTDFQIYRESLGELSPSQEDELLKSIGQPLAMEELPKLIDFAFLALHGPYGEDGNIQGLLEWLHIPYTGSGILPSAIGIDKSVQKGLMENAGFPRPNNGMLKRSAWLNPNVDKQALMDKMVAELGLPIVIKAPHQGSSIGITILENADLTAFEKAVNRAFFLEEIDLNRWQNIPNEERKAFIRSLTDLREGIGLPVSIGEKVIYHPHELLEYLNALQNEESVLLENLEGEEEILFEAFIKGQEFSCIVVEGTDGEPIALPPTQIIKIKDFFDYRSKYLPGMSRKVTPIGLPTEQINAIRSACETLYKSLFFDVYARLDGFITDEGEIFLNDPNTTSGMLPSSFFFHQAAEIGLNPSQFLSYLIRTSLVARLRTGKNNFQLRKLLNQLDSSITALNKHTAEKKKVAVIMGGFSSERHISVESGRNIYEKLSSSGKYEALPIFLSGDEDEHILHVIPVNIMLKDNADDIKAKIDEKGEKHPVLLEIAEKAKGITSTYAGNPLTKPERVTYEELAKIVDEVFIALHGRPGEDGSVQKYLDQYKLPYNGSGVESSQKTINKYETNEILHQNGILVAKHRLILKDDWAANRSVIVSEIEDNFDYPIIAKPADDGCSSGVKKIHNREELEAFATLSFRNTSTLSEDEAKFLQIQENEEFPAKSYILIEEMIQKGNASHFLEITGGLITSYNEQGELQYEMFEPSEALATGDVLSLEEKFLAGEGQNITPPRYSFNKEEQVRISTEVKKVLEKTARLLNVEGYCRTDAFVRIWDDGKVETIIIEINSLPGMTPATAIFHQCALNGYKPYDFIDAILDFGEQRVAKN